MSFDSSSYGKSTLSIPQVNRDYEEPWNQLIIDLDALQFNYNQLRSKLPTKSNLYAVLKSDAYGHGLAEVGKLLVQAGCRNFAVETPQEGIVLRKQGIDSEILLLNPIPVWMAEMAVYYDFSVSVIHQSILQPLEDAASSMDKKCLVHLNANVGLHRLGISPSKLIGVAKETRKKPHLRLEGIYAQPRDDKTAMEGFLRLKDLYGKLSAENIAPENCHFSNSTTFLTHPETAEFGVRLGILLYGVLPPEQFNKKKIPFILKPVMSLKTRVVQLRELSKGSKIGYRAKTAINHNSIIGTLPIGYAHGLDRKQTKDGYVLIHGEKAPYIGAISMNSSTVDLTDVPGVDLNEPVTIIGKQGNNDIILNDLAEKSGTISAEMMIRFGQGISRSYKMTKPGKIPLGMNTGTKKLANIKFMFMKTENDLPKWLTVHSIIQFLEKHLSPYNDPSQQLHEAIDYSLSIDPEGEGFIILAAIRSKIVGVVVCVHTNTTGFIPENVLVYACVHHDYRRMGIGRSLIQEAIENTDGDIKIHVIKSNPAVQFLDKMGFTSKLLEMRLFKGEKRWIQSKINIKRIKESGTTAQEPTKNRS